jgi:hypothetical protein
LLSTLKKYHNKPFEHYEKLSQIGGNNRASGEFAHSGGRSRKMQPIQPIAQSSLSGSQPNEPITKSVAQVTQPITHPFIQPSGTASNDDIDDDDDARSLDRDIAAALATTTTPSFRQIPRFPPFSGPPEAPILELTPEAIWGMAPEVARSLLGLRGDDDTPMNIESVREIMQRRAPELSPSQQPDQTLAPSSDITSTSQLSSVSGGSLTSRNSGKRKRTGVDDGQVAEKASIHRSAKRSVSAPSLQQLPRNPLAPHSQGIRLRHYHPCWLPCRVQQITSQHRLII